MTNTAITTISQGIAENAAGSRLTKNGPGSHLTGTATNPTGFIDYHALRRWSLSVPLPFSESPALGMMLSPPGRRLIARRIAMPVVELSRAARSLLRRRAAGEGVDVTPESLETYRELVRAGVMYPVSGFLKGPEAAFRFTEEGWARRDELQRPPWRLTPSASLRRIRRAFSPIGKSVSAARSTTSS